MEEEIWGWLIIIYLFMGGLGAGAYLTSFAAGKGWIGNSPALTRVGYYLAGPIVALGTILLVFDLGQGLKKPWLLIGLIMNPRSVMTWGVYILAVFICVGLLVAFFVFKKKKVSNAILNVGAILALATGTYTGLLLGAIQAVPLWNSFLLPVLFVISAISTGMSLTAIIAHFTEKGKETDERKVSQIHLFLVGAEMILIATLFGTILAGSKGQIGIESVNMILSGSLSMPFWVLLVALGLVIPFLVFAINYSKLAKSKSKLQADGASAGKGEQAAASAKGLGSGSILAVDAGVIIGGFVLRYLMIFAALPVWNGILK